MYRVRFTEPHMGVVLTDSLVYLHFCMDYCVMASLEDTHLYEDGEWWRELTCVYIYHYIEGYTIEKAKKAKLI